MKKSVNDVVALEVLSIGNPKACVVVILVVCTLRVIFCDVIIFTYCLVHVLATCSRSVH